MSNYKIIQPAGRINYIRNPQFFYNVTDGWDFDLNGGTGGSATHDETEHWIGPASANIVPTSSVSCWLYTDYTINVDNNEYVSLTFKAKGDNGGSGSVRLFEGATQRASEAFSTNGDDEWTEYELNWQNTTGSAASIQVRLQNDTADGSTTIWFDAVMFELHQTASTYIDGDQDGCWWRGEKHNSVSERSAASRAGGLVLDLKDDFDFGVKTLIDGGAPQITHYIHEYAIRPGGEIRGTKIHPSGFTLHGMFIDRDGSGDSIHAMRKTLIDEIMPWAYPKDSGQYQPVTIRYTGAATDKFRRAHYETPSMSGILGVEEIITDKEEADLNFISPDPFWYSVYQDADELNPEASAASRGVIYHQHGQDWGWDNLGTDGAWTNNDVNELIYNPKDGKIYVVGGFTDFNGNTGWDHIVRYDPIGEAWEAVGATGAVNDEINTAIVAANGDVYIGGPFTDVGDGDGDHVAYYDLSDDSWKSVAGGGTNYVSALAIARNGDLWIGGSFSNWDGSHDHLVVWDGSSYSGSIGGETFDDSVFDIRVNGDTVYLCGRFDSPGDKVATYNYTDGTWSDFGSPPTAATQLAHMAMAANGLVYFTDGLSNGGVYIYDNPSWTTIGTFNSNFFALKVRLSPNGELFAIGQFTSIGDYDNLGGVAMWTGSRWVSPGFGIRDGNEMRDILFRPQDPIIPSNYDMYIAQIGNDTMYYAGWSNTVNNGNANTYPTLYIKQTSGYAELERLENLRTGATILFDYELQEGEEVVIKFGPVARSIVSDLRGSIPYAIVAGSDESEFYLAPGSNSILLHADQENGTTEAHLIWRDTFSGVD